MSNLSSLGDEWLYAKQEKRPYSPRYFLTLLILTVLDKHSTCEYPETSGAIVFRNEMIHEIDRFSGSVLSNVNLWIEKHDVSVTAVKIPGEYIDAGTLQGLVEM